MSADRSPGAVSEVERLRAELAEVRAALVLAEHRAELAEARRQAEHARLCFEIALSGLHFYAVAEHYPATIESDEGAFARRLLDLLKIVPLPPRDEGPRRENTEEARLRAVMAQMYTDRNQAR